MTKSTTLRRVLLAPPALRIGLMPHRSIALSPTFSLRRTYSSSYVPVASKHFWLSLVPKPLRRTTGAPVSKKPRSKEWNPATFYIIIFLLIGSMSIQMIALKKSFETSIRRADAKIGILKEVIERIQKGEDVDVELMLGTGDAKAEKEWEEVLRRIEEEDQAWEKSRKSKPKHGKNLEESKAAAAEETKMVSTAVEEAPTKQSTQSSGSSRFY